MTKSIQNQLFNNDCIYSPFEEPVPIFREGKSAFADAGDVITKNKKYLLTLTTLSFFLCLVITSCSKTSTNPSSNYPTYSESGKNVFACKYNGKEFVNCNKDKITSLGKDCAYVPNEAIYFQMYNDCGDNNLEFTFTLYNPTNKIGDTIFLKSEKTYKLQFNDVNNNILSFKVKDKFWFVFTKYDYGTNICAGKFGGTLIDDKTSNDIFITDGFFDYQPNYKLQ
jgi:hypothetical protein